MKPGDTVICISNGWSYNNDKTHQYNKLQHPQEGKNYTVEGVVNKPTGLYLYITGFDEWEYHSHGFTYPELWNQAETLVNELTETIKQPLEYEKV